MDRTTIELNCPGTTNNYIVIVPTAAQAQYGVGNPENTGDCTLFLDALDGDGTWLDGSTLQLDPGQSRHWYYPPSGAAADCRVLPQHVPWERRARNRHTYQLMPVAGWHDFGEAAPALRFSTLQRQLPSRLDQHQALRLWQ